MNIDIFGSALLGLAIALLLFLWRRGSGRWSHWFPAIRKTAELVLKVAIAGVTLLELVVVFSISEDPGISLLAGVMGYGAFEGYQRFVKHRLFNSKETLNRGTRIAPVSEVRRQVFKKSKNPRIYMGEAPMPREIEPYHQMVLGATGTGKSVYLNQLLSKIREEGDTVVVVDSGGDFVKKHFDPESDFIFNPFDHRCINWSPMYELKGEWDIDSLARSIIPDGTGENKEWNTYAQTFLIALMRKLWSREERELKDLLYYACVAPVDELRTFLEGTSASALMVSEKTFGSIRSIVATYLDSYQNLPAEGHQFSVSEMVRQEHSGFLFVTYRDDQLSSLRDLIACLLDVIARAILSLPPNQTRRVWLVIDEFASLGKIQTIEAIATKSRKAGGCLALGMQTVAQLRERYGDNMAQTIMSCLSSWLVLRSTDAETAEYVSKYIGDVDRTKMSRSVNSSDSGDSQGQNEQQTTIRAVMASEIQLLPNLEGFVRLAGGYPICKVKLDVTRVAKDKEENIAFEPRDYKNRPKIDISRGVGSSQTSKAKAAEAERRPEPATTTPVRPGAIAPSPAALKAAEEQIVAPVEIYRMPVERPQLEPLIDTHVLIRRPLTDE